MIDSHSSYEELAQSRRGSQEYREGHAEAQRAYLIGQAVSERRPRHSQFRTRRAGSSRTGWPEPAGLNGTYGDYLPGKVSQIFPQLYCDVLE